MPSPVMDWKAVERLRRQLVEKPATVHELVRQYRVSWRTIYRWLEVLKTTLGNDVVTRREGRKVYYSIVTKEGAK